MPPSLGSSERDQPLETIGSSIRFSIVCMVHRRHELRRGGRDEDPEAELKRQYEQQKISSSAFLTAYFLAPKRRVVIPGGNQTALPVGWRG